MSAAGESRFAFGPDASETANGHVLPAAPRASVSVPATASRLAGIDLLRIAAAVGIVWFHTEGAPYVQIGYAGLPIFLLIYFSLLTRQSGAHSTLEFLQRRWDRLLKPWLFWSAVYGAAKLAKAAYTMEGSQLGQMLSLETFLAGPYIHLWYLPYAFVSGLLLYVINRRLVKSSEALVIIAATVLGLLLLTASSMGLALNDLPRPLPQWGFGLAAVPLGLALGRSLAVSSRRRQVGFLALVSLTTLGVSALLVSLGFDSAAVPYSVAIALVSLAYAWPIRPHGSITVVASLTLGIYLLHPLVARGVVHLLPLPEHYIASILLTACLSAAVAWALRQTPLRRFV